MDLKIEKYQIMVWDFKSSSYKIRRIWLDNHKAHRNSNDFEAYRKIVDILGEMAGIMNEIKTSIQTAKTEETFSKVTEIITKYLGVEKEKVTLDADFVADLGADSLDTLELIMVLEEAFKIKIPDELAEKIQTVQQIVDYIAVNQA